MSTCIDTSANLDALLNDLSNKKPVGEFVVFIKQQLEASTQSWRKVAEAFREASEMYGLESNSYKELLKATNFHKSKVSKLIAIASSERLKRYSNQLSSVQSWATLYEVTTLTDEQFSTLCTDYNLDDPDVRPSLTESNVRSFKIKKLVASPFKRFAYISIDEDALKGGLLDGAALEALHNTLKEFGDTSPYIQVVETGVDEADAALYMKQVETKMYALTRKKLSTIIERKMKNTSVIKRKGHSDEQHFYQIFGISRRELTQYIFEGEALKAFEYLGAADEYNEGKLWEAAMDEVQAARKKFVNRALQRANTAGPQLLAA
jgi:hypothetical protein